MENLLPEIAQSKDLFEVRIDYEGIVISKKTIVRSLGYQEGQIPEHFEELIERILPQLAEKCIVKAGYRICDVQKVDNRHDGLYVGGTFFTTQKIIAGRMKNAEHAALFVCTVGPHMETWAGQLIREGDTLMGHLIDTVASTVVESTADALHKHLKMKMHGSGLRITNRYSPGYCGWPVSEQHALFAFFPTGFCGITLTESALMKPIKSVSGLIGIGKTVTCAGYSCGHCKVSDCTYRAFRRARDTMTQNQQ